MRINPGFQVHSLVDGTLQIGSGTNVRWITGLTADERRFVLSLCGDAQDPDGGPDRLPGPSRRAEILRLLAPVLVEEQAPMLRGLRGSVLLPDVAQWSAAYGLDARAPLAGRGSATVCIRGLDRSGQLLAWLLAAAGVGGLILLDQAPLDLGDLGTTPVGIADVGRPRAQALRRALQRVHPRLPVTDTAVRPLGEAPGVIEVIFATGFLPPIPATPGSRALLPVVLGESGARIGPMLIGELGLCADCFRARPAALPPAGVPAQGAARPIHPELSLAATVAGIAATQCLMFIDRVNIPACADTVAILDLATGSVEHIPAVARPGCRCLDRLGEAA